MCFSLLSKVSPLFYPSFIYESEELESLTFVVKRHSGLTCGTRTGEREVLKNLREIISRSLKRKKRKKEEKKEIGQPLPKTKSMGSSIRVDIYG